MHTRGALGAVAVVLALVVGAVSWAVTASAGADTSPKNAGQAFVRDRDLLAHLPDAVRTSCLLIDSSAGRGKPGKHYVAEIECHPDSATTIRYLRYANSHELVADFDRIASNEAATSCGERDTYSVDHVDEGEWICGTDNSHAQIVWTFEPLDVLAFLERNDGDTDAATRSWSADAGPDRAAHRVPALLSKANAARANRDLLAQIPHATRYHCRVVDLSQPANNVEGVYPSPNLWADAVVTCANRDVPGSVTYRQFRDPDAYDFAYDAVTYLTYAEPNDPVCGGGYEATWSVDGHEVGSVACDYEGAAPSGEAHVLWTYDPDMIVAEAIAVDQPSAAAEYRWWQQSSGPTG